jgi:predicted DNA-binding transcriptional regulator AlpA
MDDADTLDIETAARLMQVSTKTFLRRVADGDYPARIPGLYPHRWRRADLVGAEVGPRKAGRPRSERPETPKLIGPKRVLNLIGGMLPSAFVRYSTSRFYKEMAEGKWPQPVHRAAGLRMAEDRWLESEIRQRCILHADQWELEHQRNLVAFLPLQAGIMRLKGEEERAANLTANRPVEEERLRLMEKAWVERKGPLPVTDEGGVAVVRRELEAMKNKSKAYSTIVDVPFIKDPGRSD